MASKPSDVFTANFRDLRYLVEAVTSDICLARPPKGRTIYIWVYMYVCLCRSFHVCSGLFWYFYLSPFVSFCLFLSCLSIWTSSCPLICLSLCSSVRSSTCPCLSVLDSVCMSFRHSVGLSIYTSLPVDLVLKCKSSFQGSCSSIYQPVLTANFTYSINSNKLPLSLKHPTPINGVLEGFEFETNAPANRWLDVLRFLLGFLSRP